MIPIPPTDIAEDPAAPLPELPGRSSWLAVSRGEHAADRPRSSRA